MPDIDFKRNLLIIVPLVAALNNMTIPNSIQLDSIDMNVSYFITVCEERRLGLNLPSGQQCRKCSSDKFYLEQIVQDDTTYDKPVSCEKYVCDNCGREIEYWKYSE
jgi:hypothetical protein